MLNIFVALMATLFLVGCSTATPAPQTVVPVAEASQLPTVAPVIAQSPLVEAILRQVGASNLDEVLVNLNGNSTWFSMATLDAHNIQGYENSFSGYLNYINGERLQSDRAGRLVVSLRNTSTLSDFNGLVLEKKDSEWTSATSHYSDERIMIILGILRTQFAERFYKETDGNVSASYTLEIPFEHESFSEKETAQALTGTFAAGVERVLGTLRVDRFEESQHADFEIRRTADGYSAKLL